MKPITIASVPKLILKEGALLELPDYIREAGFTTVGLVHGRTVYARWGDELSTGLNKAGVALRAREVRGEPTPAVVDGIVAAWSDSPPQVIIALGGGSVIDAGKAAAAMLAEEPDGSGQRHSVREYLEGVGSRRPSGKSLPLYAIPTTAGTGSEATKNAVLSETGHFKKSLRHDTYIPALALIDPRLAAGAPTLVSAASGLDAITQLVEGYLSTEASPFTDALALTGLNASGSAFRRVLEAPDDLAARASMGYAAFLSGVVLANAGLGLVHGAASSLGGARDIPHGVLCGLLLPGSVRMIAERARSEGTTPVTAKIETLEIALGAEPGGAVATLEGLLAESSLPGLKEYGFTPEQLRELAEETGLKNSPVSFSTNEIADLFLSRL